MKDFDIGAARRGDPILVRSYATPDYQWTSGVHFVGADKDGFPVLQWPEGDVHTIKDLGRLAMAPIKKTVWINVYKIRNRHGILESSAHESEDQAREWAKDNPAQVLVVAVPIEITE